MERPSWSRSPTRPRPSVNALLLRAEKPFRSIPLCGAGPKLTLPRGSCYSFLPRDLRRQWVPENRPVFHFTCRTHDPPPINLPRPAATARPRPRSVSVVGRFVCSKTGKVTSRESRYPRLEARGGERAGTSQKEEGDTFVAT